MRERGRVRSWAAEHAVVSGRRHDQRPFGKGAQDRVLLDREVVGAAEAEVDDARPVGPGRCEAGDLVADGQHAAWARVPELELGLRVDAAEAGAVELGADHGRRRRAMSLLEAGRKGLEVQRRRVRPAGELRVRQIGARVDHRHRQAGARRCPGIRVDMMEPPFGVAERVGAVADRLCGLAAKR